MKEQCEHKTINITDNNEGSCANCGLQMVKSWTPKPIPQVVHINRLGEKFYDGDVFYHVKAHSRTNTGHEVERCVLGHGNSNTIFDIGKTKESAYRLAFEELLGNKEL